MSHYVYFIQMDGDGPIKIGSTWNVPTRLRALQHANPAVLSLLDAVRCVNKSEALTLERSLHQQLQKSCIRGEWYEATAEVMATIRDPDPEGDEIEAPPWADDIDRKNLATLTPTYRRHILAKAARQWGALTNR